MAENNFIADPLRFVEGFDIRKLNESIKKVTQQLVLKHQKEKNALRGEFIFPWIEDYVITSEIEENLLNNLSKTQSNVHKIADRYKAQIFHDQFKSKFIVNELTNEKVIPFLLNKIISKLIHEHTEKDYKKYSFESEGLNSFFYFNPDFTIEEVMIINDKINEKLIELTDIFEMDDLLKFSFVVTAEDLSDKETFVTYGMPCG
ncbi:hypothetical protein [Acinetobacter sp. RW6]|uniref:hypothetical protein n=1 Tax=Acinetobacter sp. RW6 TaxID=3242680 RepID=UPI0035BF549F